MKVKILITVQIILFAALYGKAQITVDCDNKIGLGNEMTNPGYAIDILGATRICPSSGGDYITISNDNSYGWVFNANGNGIGMLGYQNSLYSVKAHDIYASNIVYSSDKSLKKNIRTLYDALPLIKKLRPVSFDYNYDYSGEKNVNLRTRLETGDKNRLGFIAQEVQKVLPQSVSMEESDSTLCIRMMDFVPLLVKGMQEQLAYLDSLKSELNELKESENAIKSARIESLESVFETEAKLYQNSPNPFSERTVINCFIPKSSNNARLLIFNTQGTLVKTCLISGRNQTSVTIAGSELNAGVYIYSLIIDNKEIDSKRMILGN